MKRVIVLSLLLFSFFGGSYTAQEQTLARLPSPDVQILLTGTDGNHGVCSGVYLGHGVVLTAKHCTGDDIANAQVVLDQDGVPGPKTDAFLEWASDTADVATYHLATQINARSARLSCRPPRINEPIEVVGNPLGNTFIHNWGKVAGLERVVDGELDEVPVDISAAPGDSGGPVYDAAGNVLGIFNEDLHDSRGRVLFMVSGEAACGKYRNPELFKSVLSHWFGRK